MALMICVLAASCDLLPSDGPNANGVFAHSFVNLKSRNPTVTRFALVSLDDRTAEYAENYYKPVRRPVPAEFQGPSAFGRVGVGDLLKVTLWEAGDVGLLSGRDRRATELAVRVDIDGTIALPYAGRFAVAGKRLSDIEPIIVSHLSGQAVQPQASVIIAENVSNSVSVQGEVNKPGPYVIARPNTRLLDVIAMAGGTRYAPHEVAVRLTRGRTTLATTMQSLIDQPDEYDIAVSAGDAVLLARQQEKFLAFGAVALPGEQAFRKTNLTLSDGLGQVLGLDPARSDAKGVYLFRREPVELAKRYGLELLPEDRDTVPIVYQLDLKAPQSFFLMSRFPLRPNDIVYVATAPLSEAARFFQILSGATSSVAIPRTLLGNYPTGN
jgi:polysaccharide export outer membrane protein